MLVGRVDVGSILLLLGVGSPGGGHKGYWCYCSPGACRRCPQRCQHALLAHRRGLSQVILLVT
jgi:hypothetical protein